MAWGRGGIGAQGNHPRGSFLAALPPWRQVPTALTDTFDAPGHPADTLGAAALYLMEAAGAELYGDVV